MRVLINGRFLDKPVTVDLDKVEMPVAEPMESGKDQRSTEDLFGPSSPSLPASGNSK